MYFKIELEACSECPDYGNGTCKGNTYHQPLQQIIDQWPIVKIGDSWFLNYCTGFYQRIIKRKTWNTLKRITNKLDLEGTLNETKENGLLLTLLSSKTR